MSRIFQEAPVMREIFIFLNLFLFYAFFMEYYLRIETLKIWKASRNTKKNIYYLYPFFFFMLCNYNGVMTLNGVNGDNVLIIIIIN